MKKYKFNIILDILLLIGVVYLFSMCSSRTNPKYNTTDGPYSINHYVDTIDNHIILTTVCHSKININVSVATLELKD